VAPADAVPAGTAAAAVDPIAVRDVRRADLDRVIAIDAGATGIEKRRYWLSVYRRYAAEGRTGRHFLVAVAQGRVRGFIVGEVRDWEFGSPPCGWVFGIDVEPGARLGGIGTRLLDAICTRFRRDGVSEVRTMLARDNTLILSFFRSQGMMAGPFIALEKSLTDE
jgi:ribosomal protein S18 acetylase RimI-like enzyme